MNWIPLAIAERWQRAMDARDNLSTESLRWFCGANGEVVIEQRESPDRIQALGQPAQSSGAILPGLALWPEMLALRTAQLPRVQLRKPRAALGRSTEDAIVSGVFHGHVGAVRETVERVRSEAFGRSRCRVLGTGGHADRFAGEKLFTEIQPALILEGLHAFAVRAPVHNVLP